MKKLPKNCTRKGPKDRREKKRTRLADRRKQDLFHRIYCDELTRRYERNRK
ncbi:MAG: hypothetical protein JW827_08930 [Spirochaetes bacterium]|nr:hypothetical protein [Spirochaetota bacterium]